MPSRLRSYKDKEKAAAYRKRHRDKYYLRCTSDCSRSREPWEKWELDLIVDSQGDVLDKDLAKILHGSLRAIQIQRCRLKNKNN